MLGKSTNTTDITLDQSQFNFVVPKIKKEWTLHLFFFNAIKDWNTLPNIKAIYDHDVFKAATNQHVKNK